MEVRFIDRIVQFFKRDEKMSADDRGRFIQNYISAHQTENAKRLQETLVAERYYENENDILFRDRFRDINAKRVGLEKNPLRNADNRVSHNWHGLLLNQKAGYLGSIPPTFDANKEEYNKHITKTLGAKFKKVFTDLIINAGNAGEAWLHYWKDAETGEFKYMSINPKECFPIYSNEGDGALTGFIRRYGITLEDGSAGTCYEYWDDTSVEMYVSKNDSRLYPYNHFVVLDKYNPQNVENVHFFEHGFGTTPFIRFANNKVGVNDLRNIKQLIDVYDKVFSGFINDIDDIQQMIFILTNYGGQDKEEFLQDLMYYKVVKIDSDDSGDGSGLETMTIDIPVEARNEVLKRTEEQLWIQGQGVNPTKDNMNNTSGIALKYLYSLLDMKAGILEAEFMPALEEFIKMMLQTEYGTKNDEINITQVWTRSAISDDLEQAEIISRVANVSSSEAIAKSNPLVKDDWEKELALRKKEAKDLINMQDSYAPVNEPQSTKMQLKTQNTSANNDE